MKQLGQLQPHSKELAEENAEVIVVFREEQQQAEGLKKIKKSEKTNFTLVSDLGAKATAKYSSGRREFDNYVIDKNGTIRATIDGTLRQRATAEAILSVLKKINAE